MSPAEEWITLHFTDNSVDFARLNGDRIMSLHYSWLP